MHAICNMDCPEINGFITGGIYMFYEKKVSTVMVNNAININKTDNVTSAIYFDFINPIMFTE